MACRVATADRDDAVEPVVACGRRLEDRGGSQVVVLSGNLFSIGKLYRRLVETTYKGSA